MTPTTILLGTLACFVVGLLFGGVLNGLADNLPTGSALRGRNHLATALAPRCDYCGEPRRGWRRLALFQTVADGNHCGQCTAPRKRRDLIVELGMSAALAALWLRSPDSIGDFAGGAIVLGLFVLTTIIDFEHRLVLMDVSLAGGALLLGVAALGGLTRIYGALIGAGAAAGVFLLLYVLGFAFLRLMRYQNSRSSPGVWRCDSGGPGRAGGGLAGGAHGDVLGHPRGRGRRVGHPRLESGPPPNRSGGHDGLWPIPRDGGGCRVLLRRRYGASLASRPLNPSPLRVAAGAERVGPP